MTEIIMFDSDAAATHRTDVKGWVSRAGHFYGDGEHGERTARFDGCTHHACDSCGEPTEKHYIKCRACRHKEDIERYEAMPFLEWDYKTPLYSHRLDEYIFDDVEEFLEEQIANGGLDIDTDTQSLRLVICEPRMLTPIDEEHWLDDLPEDYDLPDDVMEELKEFNETLKNAGYDLTSVK